MAGFGVTTEGMCEIKWRRPRKCWKSCGWVATCCGMWESFLRLPASWKSSRERASEVPR